MRSRYMCGSTAKRHSQCVMRLKVCFPGVGVGSTTNLHGAASHPGQERNCVIQDVHVAESWRKNGSFRMDRERKMNFHIYYIKKKCMSSNGKLEGL